ncbi:zinc-dependent alcohol dehydrogenase family protein [Sphingomonas sp. IC4-52]|uniref:zinc-dependent alcohol dehydrogenase family protein n=1 Tax=Sphingomonas sp. IC4-52 TaxID=2887202 RepID=UPI001D1108B8|nr:NAD(P)-dependent alcohol dehydrogenase [Sphingomonas sp. IC4-52]MCC2978804.1 NAD(P)-dependent alcohol dehydrogenase [Sphingomonas sp. IC4-52]
MRAIKLAAPGGLDRLTVSEQADPGQPKAGEVRVALHATSLNFHDYLVCSGKSPTADGRIPMADGAGVVEAIGEGVTDFQVGDHVVSCFFPDWQAGPPTVGDFRRVPGDGIDGFARDAVVLPATAFTKAPAGWSHKEAATITTAGLTAWRALVVDAGLKAGDTVLALGTGGVSIYALQIARAMGAQVIVTSSSDEKLARAKDIGATHTINYRSEPKWGQKVMELTGGRGVDVVVEVGGPGTLGQSLQAVRIGGHVALIGVLTGVSGEVPTALLMAKQARLQGLIVGSRQEQEDFVRALDANGVRPVIDRTFAFENLADAFRHQESGSHFGKIVVSW